MSGRGEGAEGVRERERTCERRRVSQREKYKRRRERFVILEGREIRVTYQWNVYTHICILIYVYTWDASIALITSCISITLSPSTLHTFTVDCMLAKMSEALTPHYMLIYIHIYVYIYQYIYIYIYISIHIYIYVYPYIYIYIYIYHLIFGF